MTRRFTFLILAVSACTAQAPPSGPFKAKPYLQLGDSPKMSARESVEVLCHAEDRDQAWSAEVRAVGQTRWRKAEASVLRRVNVKDFEPHRVYRATLTGLAPSAEFEYRVLLAGSPVFESKARARRAEGQPHTFAVMGDMSQDSEGQRGVAHQTVLGKPEYTVAVGDIVYSRGLVSEYYKKFYPVYNADAPDPKVGGPLLRSTISFGILGNHDASPKIDLGSHPDALAYFYYWSQPMNGPVALGAQNQPELKGSPEQLAEFHRSAPNYPRMAMYSFDYGDVHWTMLDSNPYVDWTDPALRDWVRNDIRSSKKIWKFVTLHHPPFQSSKAHFNDQWMRLVSDIFEEEKVDVVFSGHVHNYQRSHPIRFKIDPLDAAERPMKKGKIAGQITADKTYDGAANTKPNGVIWIVTGAGGAGLYDRDQELNKASWQEFTAKFFSNIHSVSLVDISPSKMTLRQIAADGRELDRWSITK
ncbi:MAG: metallophosphoesterase [Bryobacteraceae bacterium]|nr:metallophosphoesterase [Bryobacteraceae bacterium]